MTALTRAELEAALSAVPGWRLHDGKLLQDRQFPTFPGAMRFINQVAELAEQRGHHPDIDIRYNHVRLALVTHDAGGITERDFEMAATLSLQFPPA